MSNVGIGLGLPDSAEEEFMEAVRKQSIGVRPSKDPVSKFTNQISPPSVSFFFSDLFSKKHEGGR